MKQIFSAVAIALLVSAAYLIISPKVSAQCPPVYGGTCPTVNVDINKQVQNPQTGIFVDDLGRNINDPKFGPDTPVTFRLIVTNTSGNNIARVVVRDVFPQFINFNSGPGNFNAADKTLTFEVTSLNAGESRTFTLQGRTVVENQIPADLGLVCDPRTTNQTTVAIGDNPPIDSDSVQICIERKVLGGKVVIVPAKVTEVPVTGVSLVHLLFLVPTALAGLKIRRAAAIAQKAL